MGVYPQHGIDLIFEDRSVCWWSHHESSILEFWCHISGLPKMWYSSRDVGQCLSICDRFGSVIGNDKTIQPATGRWIWMKSLQLRISQTQRFAFKNDLMASPCWLFWLFQGPWRMGRSWTSLILDECRYVGASSLVHQLPRNGVVKHVQRAWRRN